MTRRRPRRPAPAAADAALDAAYAQIPAIACKGLCQRTCTVIDMSVRERQRIAERGVIIPDIEDGMARAAATGTMPSCPALGAYGQCTVYDIRPMVCRQWGVVETLRCPYGCVADGILTHVEGMELLGDALAAGGTPPRYAGVTREVIRTAMQDPEIREATRQLVEDNPTAHARCTHD